MRHDIGDARPGGRSARTAVVVASLVATLAAACTGGPTSPDASGGGATPGPDALVVVTTTTVFADMVEQVGGTRVAVRSLVPKGGEVHTFDPSPSDARRVNEAQLIVYNGLGLDDWLVALADDAGATAPRLALAEDLPGVTYIDDQDGKANPHLWLDVSLAERYVERIVAALGSADPADAAAYEAGGRAYLERLTALDEWVAGQLAALPQSDRRVVSFHDAFPYYAGAYGLEIVGTLLHAPGQDPSAGEVADLVAAIRDAGVSAILAEAQFNDELAQTIADETGATVVSDLYTDTLGDAPLDTLEGIVRWDTDRIVEALR